MRRMPRRGARQAASHTHGRIDGRSYGDAVAPVSLGVCVERLLEMWREVHPYNAARTTLLWVAGIGTVSVDVDGT